MKITNRQIKAIIEHKFFDPFILFVVTINCIVIALQTCPLSPSGEAACAAINNLCLLIYVAEIGMKLSVYGKGFFKSGWNMFDFTIVAFSLIPSSILPFPAQAMRLIRAFRAMRALLVVSAFKPLQTIVESIFRSLPSVAWTMFLLFIVTYIYAIAGFYLFGEQYPEYFGDLASTFFTLFQLTTMENWADVARQIMEMNGWAAFYFISFVIIGAFIIVNVVVGIIVGALEHAATHADILEENPEMSLRTELEQLQEQIDRVNYLLETNKHRRPTTISSHQTARKPSATGEELDADEPLTA